MSEASVTRRAAPPRSAAKPLAAREVVGAAPVVGEEPFAVLLADDLLDGEGAAPVMRQMVDVYNYNRCSVLGVMNVDREQTKHYGVVSTERDSGEVQRVTGIVEKPKPEEAPSTQAVIGRLILASEGKEP